MAARGVRSSARLSGGGGSAGGAAVRPALAGGGGGGDGAMRRARAAERLREVEDSPRVLRDKCRRLAAALRDAKHLIVYTGAGISTAADIPDYRGPHGVWTRLQRGETVGRVEVAGARPTFTHMALTALWARGALKFVVSQNCDGLHVRAGLPRRALAELHGNMFAERCAACRRVYLRDFDTTERTARYHHGTRRLCHRCGAELADTIVHFGERGRAAWPLNWAGALRHAARADVVLCLGSSLKVLRRYPRLWRMERGPAARPRLYIVNLQWTPKDGAATLKINARCDDVMRAVARRLRLRVPQYRASADPLRAHAEPLAPPEAHTACRAPRALPLALALAAPPAPPPSPPPLEELGSPSASESEEELPLRHLADRLRACPVPAPALTPTPKLHAFKVQMADGEATVLLRAEHAPSESAAAPPVPAPAGVGAGSSRRVTSELRLIRIPHRHRHTSLNGSTAPRHALSNGGAVRLSTPYPASLHADRLCANDGRSSPLEPPFARNGTSRPRSKLRRLLERASLDDATLRSRLPSEPGSDPGESEESKFRPKMEKIEVDAKTEPDDSKSEKTSPLKREPNGGDGGEEGAWSLAAAIIARAVVLCRGSLYPGLHTILAPEPASTPASAPVLPPVPPPEAECPWCWAARGARRCLWYGAPRLTAVGARALRHRRYLCTCCGEGAASPPRGVETGTEGGGWYGKGYRKGRRRR